jgi:hypothetical protein
MWRTSTRPSVNAPIFSATNLAKLGDILKAAQIGLTAMPPRSIE